MLNIESRYEITKVECYDATRKYIPCALDGNILDVRGVENGVYYFRVETIQGPSVLSYIKND